MRREPFAASAAATQRPRSVARGNHAPALRGIYAVTDARQHSPGSLAAQVSHALDGGVRLVQYRDKDANPRRRMECTRALLAVCRRAGVPLVVNDCVDTALAAGADGVHIGGDDGALVDARRRLGPDALIGVSCYDSLALARAAQADGASYVAFGSFFASPTKPLAVRAPVELLVAARAALTIPIAAIGGIDAGNGAPLVAAGADLLAVVSSLFASPDITAAARALTRLYADPVACDGSARHAP